MSLIVGIASIDLVADSNQHFLALSERVELIPPVFLADAPSWAPFFKEKTRCCSCITMTII